MREKPLLPANRSVDDLGREYSSIVGYGDAITVPLGSHVTLLPGGYPYGRATWLEGAKVIVTAHGKLAGHRGSWARPLLHGQLLEGRSDWEPQDNLVLWSPSHVFVDKVGTGKVPEAGVDYPLTAKQRFDEKWRTTDHTYQSWSNPATFLAQLYLTGDSKHHSAVLAMVRANGSINPTRLENYFWRKSGLVIDDWARSPDGFPNRSEYQYRVNWAEVARSFEETAREGRALAA
ncbi:MULTISPECIES: hypothetical protein [unclassified Variovorax]|uniref:hypothetical protein n=1 Tax=unclassified Variovorax TaxID=663243 RepID=UPI00076C885D|nr:MULTISPECIES: hypothetical protein [unclassified Variovorax]KWT98502.1 hypothetical protein APY03_0637 [Variovorax sp. WDL1]PNG49821.1 hypothetical protein CHC06_05402 [Variovorax sp. B2]PNG50693.1 hypothetical protein CHC07_05307 [Variovorax sp. B4]VTV17886.1 hypothetical protein WDL1P1_00740 [Variovorax sp. WDL1]